MPSNDMVITAHVLERMEERWPKFCRLTDAEVARVVKREVTEAIEAGRWGHVAPVELISVNTHMHSMRASGTSLTCWTKDKMRGYIFREDHEGLVVVTVFPGQEREESIRRKLYR